MKFVKRLWEIQHMHVNSRYLSKLSTMRNHVEQHCPGIQPSKPNDRKVHEFLPAIPGMLTYSFWRSSSRSMDRELFVKHCYIYHYHWEIKYKRRFKMEVPLEHRFNGKYWACLRTMKNSPPSPINIFCSYIFSSCDRISELTFQEENLSLQRCLMISVRWMNLYLGKIFIKRELGLVSWILWTSKLN